MSEAKKRRISLLSGDEECPAMKNKHRNTAGPPKDRAGNTIRVTTSEARKRRIPAPSSDEECPAMKKKRLHTIDLLKDRTTSDLKRKRPANTKLVSESLPCSSKRQRLGNDAAHPDSHVLAPVTELTEPSDDEAGNNSIPNLTPVGQDQAPNTPEQKLPPLLEKAKGSKRHRGKGTQLSSKEKWAHGCLQRNGIPLFRSSYVQDISSLGLQSLGSGSYGACFKAIHPNTLKPLVIKTFPANSLDDLVVEAINLQQLQLFGVQRLVGVCVKTRQIITEFGGSTAERYFSTKPHFADTISVFLKISRILQRILRKGFAHNDIKGDNVCVQTDNNVQEVTLIDLGLARRVGTLKIYAETPNTSKFPWLAPELLRYTHPCCEASDVYSLAHLMKKVLCLKKRGGKSPSLAALEDWLWRAQCIDPSKRPSLSALTEVLETLLLEAMKGSTLE